ncbi:MAG: hypothetical protein ABIH72_04515 [archaeon]
MGLFKQKNNNLLYARLVEAKIKGWQKYLKILQRTNELVLVTAYELLEKK